jgi:hypothetical protein
MKRYLPYVVVSSLLLIAVIVFLIMPKGPIDLEAELKDEIISSTSVISTVEIGNIDQLEDLEEIGYTVISLLYEKHQATYGLNTWTLKVELIDGETSYGTLEFIVNESIQKPGLQLIENRLNIS